MTPILINYYTDKTVCIIGGALTSDELFYDENQIDTYVQVNDHCKRNGKPVDVLYHAATEDLGLPWFGSKIVCYHICGVTAKLIEEYCKESDLVSIPYRKEVYKGRNSPFGPEFDWLTHFMKDWEVDPLSGIIALVDVLRHNPKKVLLTGMTLYSNGVNLPERRNNHYIQPHVDFLKHLQATEPRVLFDEALETALSLPVKHVCSQTEYERLSARLAKKSSCHTKDTEIPLSCKPDGL